MSNYAIKASVGQIVKLCYIEKGKLDSYTEEFAVVEEGKGTDRNYVRILGNNFNIMGRCQDNIDNKDEWIYWIEKV